MDAAVAHRLSAEYVGPFNPVRPVDGDGTQTPPGQDGQDQEGEEHQGWRPIDSWASRISWAYCRNRSAFAFAVFLLALFLVIATAMNIHYRCWQWRTEPIASAVIERRKRHLSTPYSYFG